MPIANLRLPTGSSPAFFDQFAEASARFFNRQSAIGNRQLEMFLIVGLGNPGEEYAHTRHNLGFMLLDKLAADAAVSVRRSECRSLVGSGLLENERVKLAKPQTFMNLSGEAVSCLISKSELDAAKLIVISDDLALPFGSIRLRPRGSAGGHNGLKSIISSLGTNEFIRLRIGIQPDHAISDAKNFVLHEFTRTEKESLPEILGRAAEAIRSVLRDGVVRAMSSYNSKIIGKASKLED